MTVRYSLSRSSLCTQTDEARAWLGGGDIPQVFPKQTEASGKHPVPAYSANPEEHDSFR